jgi:methylaspartate mutase epsilon subunit
LDEVVQYFQTLPKERFWQPVLKDARERNDVIVFPRLGYADIDELQLAMERVRTEGGAGAVSIHIDSLTRWHRYDEAAQRVAEGRRTGKNLLNGYPVVHYGVQRTRELFDAVNMPTLPVTGSEDARLLDELMIAGGVSASSASIVPPPFSYTTNKLSLEEALQYGLYGDRLAGWYVEHGVPLLVNVRGCNCGTARPPSINLALTLVEILAALEQGCRYFYVTYYLNSSLVQDIAYLRSAIPIAEKYARQAGYTDCAFFLNGSHYDGVFPEDPSEAMAVLCYQALVARMAGIDMLHTKTLQEGSQLPTIDGHVQSCKAMRCTMDILGGFRFPDEPLEAETATLREEVDSLMNNMLEAGDGDILRGFVAAIKGGTMEFPFSPSKYNAGEAIIVRDRSGAARFLDPGRLALPDRAVRYHRDQLEKVEGAELDPLQLMYQSIRYLGGFQVVK